MSKIIEEIEKQITALEAELNELREWFEKVDANNVQAQINVGLKIGACAEEIEMLKRFKKRFLNLEDS